MRPGDLHSQLRADCHVLGGRPGGLVLLHRNAVLPWLIFVPDAGERDFFDLDTEEQTVVLEVCQGLADFIREEMDFPKVNFATLGNVVPQLHVHVVGRKPGDTCWPAPVWGNLQEEARYSDADLAQIRAQLKQRSLIGGN